MTAAFVRPFAAAALTAGVLMIGGAAFAQDAAVPPAEAAAPVAAPTPVAEAPAADGVVGAPSAGKGQVVFFRPSAFVGMAISYKVREGEAELGTLSNGRYFVTQVDPGAHTYTVHSEAKDNLKLEVEAGETYYVTSSLSMGVAVGRPNIAPADKAAFDAVSKKLKPAKAAS